MREVNSTRSATAIQEPISEPMSARKEPAKLADLFHSTSNPVTSMVQHLAAPTVDGVARLAGPAIRYAGELAKHANNIEHTEAAEQFVSRLQEALQRVKSSKTYQDSAWYRAKPGKEWDGVRLFRWIGRLFGGGNLAHSVDAVNSDQLGQHLATIRQKKEQLARDSSARALQSTPLEQEVRQQMVQASALGPRGGLGSDTVPMSPTEDRGRRTDLAAQLAQIDLPTEVERRRVKDELDERWDADDITPSLTPILEADEELATEPATPKMAKTEVATRVASPAPEAQERVDANELAAQLTPLPKRIENPREFIQQWTTENLSILKAMDEDSVRAVGTGQKAAPLAEAITSLWGDLQHLRIEYAGGKNTPAMQQLETEIERVQQHIEDFTT